MNTSAIITLVYTFVVKIAPELLKLINAAVAWGHDQGVIAEAKRQEIAEATQNLNSTVAKAADAAQQAELRHRKDQSDGAMQLDFWRD